MDQIVGIIALVFCAGILIYQYAVRRKRDKELDSSYENFKLYSGTLNQEEWNKAYEDLKKIGLIR